MFWFRLLWYPIVPFDIKAVDTRLGDFFDTGLRQCIIVNGNNKLKVVTLPLSITAVFQPFRVYTISKTVAAPACTERGISSLSQVEIVTQKSEMGTVNNFNKRKVLGIVGNTGISVLDQRP